MPRKRQDRELVVRYHAPEYATEEEAAAGRARGEKALVELVKHLARVTFDQEYKELIETGESRWMSSDPNVDWAAHDARWALRDAEKERQRQQALAEEKAQKREERRRRKAQVLHQPLPAEPVTEASRDMAGPSMERRLEIADEISAAHPGRPVSGMLKELFPELCGTEQGSQ